MTCLSVHLIFSRSCFQEFLTNPPLSAIFQQIYISALPCMAFFLSCHLFFFYFCCTSLSPFQSFFFFQSQFFLPCCFKSTMWFSLPWRLFSLALLPNKHWGGGDFLQTTWSLFTCFFNPLLPVKRLCSLWMFPNCAVENIRICSCACIHGFSVYICVRVRWDSFSWFTEINISSLPKPFYGG